MSISEVAEQLLTVPSLRTLIIDSRGRADIPPENNEDDIFLPLNKDELSRLRFRLEEKEYEKDFNLGPRWGPALSLYRNVLEPEVGKRFSDFLDVLQIRKYKSDNALRKTFSELTILAKKREDPIMGIETYYLQYLENFGGYKATVVDDLDETARSWVKKRTKTREYMRYFTKAVREVLKDIFVKIPEKIITKEQFVQNKDLWATQGSSSEKETLVIHVNGKRIPLQKTKLASALVLTDEEVMRLLNSHVKQHNKVTGKRELTKIRAVIAGDMETYLKMRYVSFHIDQMVRSTKSPLWLNKNENKRLWQDIIGSVAEHYKWKFPFDQSEFDRHATTEMVLCVIKGIVQILKAFHMPGEVISTCEDVLYALDGGVLELSTGELIEILNGIMSGWEWTAKLDTIINRSQLVAWKMWFSDKYGRLPSITDEVYFGDDIAMAGLFVDDLINYAWFMIQNEYVVNPKKVFISKNRTEFLRKLILKDKAIGYAARAINSLFWRNPVSPEPPAGNLRASEQMNSWATLLSRGANYARVMKYMVRDISKGNNIPKHQVENLLSTPKSCGGLGWKINYNHSWSNIVSTNENINLPQSAYEYKRDNNRVLEKGHLPGLKYTNNYWGISPPISPNSLGSWNGLAFKKGFKIEDAEQYKYHIARMPTPAKWKSPISGPVWNEDVPRFMIQSYINELISDRNVDFIAAYEKINKRIKNNDVSDKIYRNWGKRCWKDWINDALPFNPPMIPLVDPSLIDAAYSPLKDAVLDNMITKRRNYKNILEKAISLEWYVQNNWKTLIPTVKLVGR